MPPPTATAKAGTVLSVLFGLWALVVAASPFFPSAAGAAAFGLAFGLIAVRAGAVQRWRKAAFVGIAANCVALAAVVVLLALAL